ncbi:hypothetical protein GSD1FS_1072 [Bifidobacterium sp. GSD1FS]|uniref:Uncharacterized protein n=1 Tax=Bifidobacterium canis TaxID=2610880 RepID=A0A7K1J599_9BIFI|nr:hypothetical protein [Bifidobacterium canis]
MGSSNPRKAVRTCSSIIPPSKQKGSKHCVKVDTVEFESKTTEKGELATKVVKIKRS